MDRLRLVTFAKNGRPIPQRDLNDGSVFSILRDTFQLTPPQSNPILASSARRFEGDVQVGESHANGQIASEWYVDSGTSKAATFDIAEAFVAQLNDATKRQYIEWRPDGAPQSVYYELRTTVEPQWAYRWIESVGRTQMHLKAQAGVSPLARGDAMWIFDDFLRPELTLPAAAATSMADYTQTISSGGFQITAGNVLQSTAGGSTGLFVHSAKGFNYGDLTASVGFTTGASGSTGSVTVYERYSDANNWVSAAVTGGNLVIQQNVAGTITTLATSAFAPAASTAYILRVRTEGTTIVADVTASATTGGLVASRTALGATTNSGTMTTAAANAVGPSAFKLSTLPTDWAVTLFTADPFTYFNKAGTMQTLALLGNIPGSAPALVEADVSIASATNKPVFALLSSWQTITGTGGGGSGPLGVLDYPAAVSASSNISTVANTSALGGNMSAVTAVVKNGLATIDSTIDPALLIPDDFTDAIYLDIWARMYIVATAAAFTIATTLSPVVGSTTGNSRYAIELGSVPRGGNSGKGNSGFFFSRMGTFVLPVDSTSAIPWKLETQIIPTGSAFVAGDVGIDFMLINPIRSRLFDPTAKLPGSTYPSFAPGAVTKRIGPDGSGSIAALNGSIFAQDTGLSGAGLLLRPGANTVVYYLSDRVPDDPSAAPLPETAAPAGANAINASLTLRVTPRYYLTRGVA